jgi:hypothetical protein
MHLLNTTTLRHETFVGRNTPDYAILSHRWDTTEASFQDVRDGKAAGMPGFAKIQQCCAQAALDGWDYAWIDSCCIDKTSSAELSEAINSMFQWYRDSQVCYAYLRDVPAEEDHRANNSFFRCSEWFTRGWTLQELLAPMTLVFFDHKWVDIGTKSSLGPLISSITGIEDLNNWKEASVAQKMSWAAKRVTTRVEDSAYSLLGLFGVNMPPLYGEGTNAFMRLQLEILKVSQDHSIFAWTSTRELEFDEFGLLAWSPAAFLRSGRVRTWPRFSRSHPWSMTNRGLHIELNLRKTTKWDIMPRIRAGETFLAELACDIAEGHGVRVAIYLKKLKTGDYARLFCDQLISWIASIKGTISAEPVRTLIYVVQPNQTQLNQTVHRHVIPRWFLMTFRSPPGRVFPPPQRYLNFPNLTRWDDIEGELRLSVDLNLNQQKFNPPPIGALMFTRNPEESFVVIVDAANQNASPSTFLLVVLSTNTLSLWEIVHDLYIKEVGNSSSSAQTTAGIRKGGPYGCDRISKYLLSGASVSVALKKVTTPHQDYLIEITYDKDGWLKWPDLSCFNDI